MMYGGQSKGCFSVVKRQKNFRTAFTLLETLITIMIIAILTAVLLPTLGSVKNAGETAKCSHNLRQLGAGIMLYAGDNNMTLPPGYENSKAPDANAPTVAKDSPYRGFPERYLDLGVRPWKLLTCPSDHTPSSEKWRHYSSYAQNGQLLVSFTNGEPDYTLGGKPMTSYVRLDEASKKILFADGIDPTEAKFWTGGWPAPNVNGDGVAGSLLSQYANSTLSSRHRGKVNCLFGDGSVRFLTKAEASDWRYLNRDTPIPE